MAREDHQPQAAQPARPQRSKEELQAACGRTIAFVLALDPAAGGDVEQAIWAARHAQTPAVFALACPERAAEATEAVRKASIKGKNVPIQAIEIDPAALLERTREAADFELCNLPYGVIEVTRVLAESVLDTYESVIVLDAAQDKITSDHIYELCLDAQQHPEAQAVVSWIQWLRRLPFLLKREFLEDLEAGACITRREDGTRPAFRLRLRDHVFGEEQLAAPSVPCAAEDDFLAGCTMTALQALNLARYAKAHPGEELHSPNQELPLMGAVQLDPLSAADALLVETAARVLEEGAQIPGDEEAELAWADEFGRRNMRDFPLLNDRAHAGKLAYLDSAATSQRVDVALQAQRDFDVHENANVYRGAYPLSAQATFTLNDARKRLEDFIGAERRQTVYVANTTAATNLVAQAWGERNIGEGDLIVCSLAAHHSNFLPFLMLAERKGARVECMPYDDGGRIDQAAYHALLDERPKLVCVERIGNMFGIEEPVARMTAEAHEARARVLVDAAQSFPHVKIDVRELGADWVAVSAHKAYGPMGIGALWISPAAFDEMDPVAGGGGTVSHVSTESYYLRPQVLQYEPGTPPVSQAVGWAAAIGYLDDLGMGNVARHSAALTRHLVRGLARIDGVNIVGDHLAADGQTGLVSFTVRSVAPATLAAFLGKLGVAVRSGGHCALPVHASLGLIGTGRVSIAVHTTRDDIDAALVAIDLCRRLHEEGR